MRSRIRTLVLQVAIAVAALAAGPSPDAAVPPRVAVVVSSNLGPFAEAVDAIRAALATSVVQPEILIFDLEGKQQKAADVVALVRQANPSLIIPVGTLATAAVLAGSFTVPVVFTMVLYPAQSGFLSHPGREVTGAALDIPLDAQFQTLRRLFPEARHIGVLYNPGETGRLIEAATAVLRRHGLTLEARQVDRPEVAPTVFEELLRDVDVVWSVADSHIFTPQNTSALILAAMRSRIPLFGLSVAHVRAGALVALSCDYADVGRQTAEIVLRVLQGEKASALPPTSPRKVTLALNRRTARHLGLTIDPDLEREAEILQ
jgi:putative ABC transport system substrate-binding protein